jgi:hypothetical protein
MCLSPPKLEAEIILAAAISDWKTVRGCGEAIRASGQLNSLEYGQWWKYSTLCPDSIRQGSREVRRGSREIKHDNLIMDDL